MTISRTPSPAPPSRNSCESCPNSPASRLRNNYKRSSSSPAGNRQKRDLKGKAILEAVDKSDVVTLKQLAISREGFINNDLRKLAWPKLLGLSENDRIERPSDEVLHAHKDYNQVVLDVNRSVKRFPPGMEEEVRLSYQDILIDVIMRVLVNNEGLNYYQGYHDVCVTFLLVVGEELTVTLMDKLSKSHLREFMDVNMDRTNHMLDYLFPIIGMVNSELRRFLELSEVGTIFALSWLITWFGHVLNEFSSIVRLYDFFIACHPLMAVYMGAAVVLDRKNEVMDCQCEMPFVHSLLSNIPPEIPLEKLVSQAGLLYIRFPPETVELEARILLENRKREQRERDARIAEMKLKRQNGSRIVKSKSADFHSKSDKAMFYSVIKWTVGGVVAAVTVAAVSKSFGLNWVVW
ncbi:DgyrCDS238 [Dimorphilus gyrociliatus]|uniref:DgyrCDS238 n=1 Tax=Dimorphilus gyrociliatus TaxID=2664684 RepID=A0A7I8V3Z0_9ANNE|nr:DgyrCDS238 [Dimorphilus gyrociliatus]